MLDASLAARYANALYTSAEKEDCLDAVIEELGRFIGIFSEDGQLKKFFLHPAIPPVEKKHFLDAMAGQWMSPIGRRFLAILVDAKRINYLNLIYETVVELFNRHHNMVKVNVVSAFPLDAAVQRRLKESVERYLQKEIGLDFSVDSALLGGVKLTVEDKVIDGSVLHNLKKLETKIALG